MAADYSLREDSISHIRRHAGILDLKHAGHSVGSYKPKDRTLGVEETQLLKAINLPILHI